MNYGNANASSPYTKEDLVKSYLAAVAVSMLVGVTIRKGLAARTAAASGASLIMLNAITSTSACALGGMANNVCMRQVELQKGIEITNPETGESLGKSTACAKAAVMQTASSRIVLALPVSLPAFALIGLEKARLMPKNRYA